MPEKIAMANANGGVTIKGQKKEDTDVRIAKCPIPAERSESSLPHSPRHQSDKHRPRFPDQALCNR